MIMKAKKLQQNLTYSEFNVYHTSRRSSLQHDNYLISFLKKPRHKPTPMGVLCDCQSPICAPLQQERSKDHGNPIYVEVLTTQYKVRSHASCESYRQSKKGSANYMLCRWTNELNHEYGQVTGCIQNFRTELKETITFFRTQKLQCTIMDEKLHIELRNPLHFRIQNSLQGSSRHSSVDFFYNCIFTNWRRWKQVFVFQVIFIEVIIAGRVGII